MKPAEYSETRIVTQDTPYRVEALKGTHAGSGILHLGRVVWTKKSPEEPNLERRILAYAECIGIISVEARLLRPIP